jgi:hypothetical protein
MTVLFDSTRVNSPEGFGEGLCEINEVTGVPEIDSDWSRLEEIHEHSQLMDDYYEACRLQELENLERKGITHHSELDRIFGRIAD